MSKTKPNDAHVGALAADRPKILLVEDDAGVRRSVQLLLQAQGFDVRAYHYFGRIADGGLVRLHPQ